MMPFYGRGQIESSMRRLRAERFPMQFKAPSRDTAVARALQGIPIDEQLDYADRARELSSMSICGGGGVGGPACFAL
jgi:hypothetical protein